MQELWNKREMESMEKVKAAGTEDITDIDKTPFIEAMVPVYEKYVTSDKLRKMVEDIQATE
jgi:TRAP-type C4-dicarboxylate transport system substrate-binding protein